MTARPHLQARIATRLGTLAIDVELEADSRPLALVGPNGAGKTSLLSIILGVLRPERARIEVNGQVLVDTAAGIDVLVEQRRLGYVPQDYALFPHLTVRENVAFAVRSAASTRPRAWVDERVDAALASMGLMALAARSTESLSGGEKQRLALARALSVQPRALLLDEPLAALDVHARREVRAFLAETLRSLAIPTIVVTHDPEDVRAMAGRVLVLESGRVTQVGTPEECMAHPASRFVAEFFTRAREL
jgi:molybdate transport system ATP-binding protein